MTTAAFTRVRLRAVAAVDLAQIEPWYAEALAVAHAQRSLATRYADAKASGCDLRAIVRDGETDVVGLVDYRAVDPAKGWLTIVYIGLAGGRRGWGYGSEAVRLLEDETGARNYLANVDRRNGLGLYFWLRLGYHPAHADEAFWRAPDENDTIAMIRTER